MPYVSLPLTSYIVNSSNINTNFINSQVNSIVVVEEQLNGMIIKLLSLELLALSGEDVCLTLN